MATEASPSTTIANAYADAQLESAAKASAILQDQPNIQPPPPNTKASRLPSRPKFTPQPNPFATTATLTTHAFPSLEPTSFATYPGTHLLLPIRKDILHKAVVFEGDATRQGTASTKWRSEVHGSNRKIRPQKGTGSARLGDKKSPMLKGGGVAFGPKPRDFSTKLPRKIYDLAWRTALSYRYKQGELICVEDMIDLPDIHEHSAPRFLRDLLHHNQMGHAYGRTLFVTLERREGLFTALEAERMGREAKALEVLDVDVKDLLELGRLVVERDALEWMLIEHEEDLGPKQRLMQWEEAMQQTEKLARRVQQEIQS